MTLLTAPLVDGADVADELPKLMSLQEMLAIGLKHNPEVRAAEASVKVAEADLDRTRLEVLQKLLAFREKWQAEYFAVAAALTEVRQCEAMMTIKKGAGHPGRPGQLMLASAKEHYGLRRAKLTEIEAELPFLLGKPIGRHAKRPDSASRELIEKKLLPTARQILDVLRHEYRVGKADLNEFLPWYRRVAELEIRLAETKAKRIAAIEAHRALLPDIDKAVKARYAAGQTTHTEVLAVQYRIAETELWLLEAKGE